MASGPQYDEGPDAARRFERVLTRVISVSKNDLAKREELHQKARKGKYKRLKSTK